MGLIGCCTKFCALIALALAILIGFLRTREHPLGEIFNAMGKVRGIGKPGTEPVPDGLMPMPRPSGEMLFDLPGGDQMPANGIGMCCRPTAYDPLSVHRTVLWFLLQGGRHIDTASIYMNHDAVGLAIQDAIQRGVPRKEIFLTTKVFSDHFGYDASIERAQRMVQELRVDYIDLVLLHVPVTFSLSMIFKIFYGRWFGGKVKSGIASEPEQVKFRINTWKGLSTLKAKGLIRNLGVSNFNIEHMKEIQALQLGAIAVNQMQYHPWAPDWMKKIVSYCHQHGIVVTGYFTLGGFDNKQKVLYGDIEALNLIAKSHGRRPAQILLRWSLQKNVSIIPGTGNHKHMADNLATYEFSLSDAEMDRLDSMRSLPISENFMFMEF